MKTSLILRPPVSVVAVGVALFVAALVPCVAQTLPPNEAGVALGHFHLVVRDVEAQNRFWTALGGVPVENGPLKMFQFPGVYVLIRKGEPSGGTEGSSVNHIGFWVKNLPESVAKWEAAGLKTEKGVIPHEVYLTAPEGTRLEMIENTKIATPIASRHIHIASADPVETQSWYVRSFGAKPLDARKDNSYAEIPGVSLTFAKDGTKVAGTKGRSLDHIGFEVKNLEAFCKKLENAGVKFDQPYHQLPNSKVSLAFLTDPAGTYIELTEGLDPR